MDQNENARERPSDAEEDAILASILQKIGGGNAAKSGDGVGSLLSALIASPDIISKIPSLISTLKPIIESFTRPSAPAEATAPVAALQNEKPQQKSAGADSRTALLCAMKPYLSEERRRAVDYIIKLSRLGEILKTL